MLNKNAILSKNAKYRVKNAQGVYEVVHLETNVDQVLETEQKQFVSATEKVEWSGKATVESVDNVQKNVDKVVEDLASEVTRATSAEQGLGERITALEDLVVGGEGEGLSAVIEDIAKNKTDIADLKADVANEISARESADASINEEIAKNKTSITNLQTSLNDNVEVINQELGKKASQVDLQAEIDRAKGVEQGLDTRVSAVEAKVNANEANISTNAQAIAKEVSDRKSEIARVEGLILDEKERAEGVEASLQTAIEGKVSSEDFVAEQTRVNSALELKATKEELAAEKDRVDGSIEQINTTLEEHGSLIDTVTSLANENKEKKADKNQVAIDINAGVVQAKGYADEKLVEAKTYADGKLVEGKEYTDAEIVKVNRTISDLDTAYKAADVQVLADAKDYADKAVADLVDNAPEALDTLKELADALTENENAYDSLLEVVGTKANSADVYTKNEVNGIKSGLETSIERVETEYKKADTALSTRLVAVEDITSGVGAIRSELNTAKEDIVNNTNEIAGCKTNITANANAIAKEVTDRTQAVNMLDGKITTEKERALAAESALDGKIATTNTELQGAKTNITTNANAIAKEVTDRENAINSLDAKVDNMATVVGSTQPVGRAEGHTWIEML